MLNKIIQSLLLAIILLLTSMPLTAQQRTSGSLPDNVPELLVRINAAYVDKDYETFRDALLRLNKMRPNNSDYMYQLVLAHALLDDKSAAYNLMLKMQQQGLAYDFTKTDNSKNIRNTEVFNYVNDLMVMAMEPVGESETAFTLPGTIVMPESISWDESRQKFLVSTVKDGALLAVDENGDIEELLKADKENGMWSLMDVMVDQPRNRLWISSAATRQFARLDPADSGRSALFEFDLDSLELLRRYPVPVDGSPHVLGSMALAPNGDIYIVDRALPIIYRKAAGEQKLQAVIASQDMVSMRGAAMRPDGKIMYIADREMGILVIDFSEQRALRLGVPETLNLGGIDGLELWDNHLVVIQNGIKPQRVMRLELDETGAEVVNVRPLAVAQAEFDFPSFGTVRGDDLFYFASSQWSGGESKPVAVLRTPVNSSQDLVGPDMDKYLEEWGKTMEQQKQQHQAPTPLLDKDGPSGEESDGDH